MKVGAWTPCPRCGYTPETPEDQAKHLMVSDHYLNQADLENVSTRVEKGLPLNFQPQQVEQMAASIQATGGDRAKIRWYVLGCLASVVLVAAGIIYLIAYLTAK